MKKSFTAVAGAALIAGAGLLWFLSNPVVATVTVKPMLEPTPGIPTFKEVQERYRR